MNLNFNAMKALYTIANSIRRFFYPVYFYPNELRVKLFVRKERLNNAHNWYPLAPQNVYGTI